jgi:hypothetical protein
MNLLPHRMNLLALWHRVADRHDWHLYMSPDELALRCPTCGAHSSGWKLDAPRIARARRLERPVRVPQVARKSA